MLVKYLSAAALGQAIKSVVNFGSEIADLSDRLSVSTDAVQKWGAKAALSGGTMQDVALAVNYMNRTLSGGSDSTISALNKAGLSFQTIRAMKPEDAFNAIARAIAKIPDPMDQARIAQELFGAKAQTLLPAIRDGLGEIGNRSVIMSRSAVSSMDQMGDAMAETWRIAKVIGAELLARAARLKELNDLVDKGRAAQKQYNDVLDLAAGQAAGRLKGTRDLNLAIGEAATIEARFNASIGQTSDQQAKAVAQDAERQEALERMRDAMVSVSGVELNRIQLAIETHSANGRLLVDEADLAIALGVSEGKVRAVMSVNEARTSMEAAQSEVRQGLAEIVKASQDAEIAKAIEVAQASAQSLADIVVANQGAQDRIATDRLSRHDQEIAALRDAEQQEIASLGVRTEKNAAFYDAAKTAIEAHYQLQRDLANGTADTITERMAQMGIETKASLADAAEAAKRDFEQMRDSGQYTTDQLVDAWTRYHDQAIEATSGLDRVFHEIMASMEQAGVQLIDGLIRGWDAFKSAAMNILNQFLGYFESAFVRALIGWATGVNGAWSSAFGNIMRGYSQVQGMSAGFQWQGPVQAGAGAGAVGTPGAGSGIGAGGMAGVALDATIVGAMPLIAMGLEAGGSWLLDNMGGWLGIAPGDPTQALIDDQAAIDEALAYSGGEYYNEDGSPTMAGLLDPSAGGQYAEGGIATRPVSGTFGEAGPEALVPLDRYDALLQGGSIDLSGVEDRLDSLERALLTRLPRAVRDAVQLR
ncbi:MAG: hypothetical protein NUW22_12575 [Acidobacteria bacterium]|nr:hypothetical protein [Acidobacteriota bacterium]